MWHISLNLNTSATGAAQNKKAHGENTGPSYDITKMACGELACVEDQRKRMVQGLQFQRYSDATCLMVFAAPA